MQLSLVGSTLMMLATSGALHAQSSEADYMATVKRAAPADIVNNATIVKMSGSDMQTIQKGSNGWTCMADQVGVPMCMDAAAAEWATCLAEPCQTARKDRLHVYAVGRQGASNSDPWATGKTASNHWIETGSHVMIVGPTVKTMVGYPRDPDPDPKRPYVMWPGNAVRAPYASGEVVLYRPLPLPPPAGGGGGWFGNSSRTSCSITSSSRAGKCRGTPCVMKTMRVV